MLPSASPPRAVGEDADRSSFLRPWRHPAPFDFHFGEDWREELEAQMADGRWLAWNDETRVDRDLAAHVTMTLSRGVCLCGRPIGEVFPAVPRDDTIDSIPEFHPTVALALDIYRGDAEPGALRAEYLAPFAAHVTNRAGARPAPTS